MKSFNLLKKGLLLLAFAAVVFSVEAKGEQVRKTVNIDKDWKFHLGDVQDGQAPDYNDAYWRKLDVPHDWSIEGPYDQNATTLRGGGYLPAGIGWYRKEVAFPKADAKKRVYIEFEGVMANSKVWINGQLLGHRPIGYLPLFYDITDHVTFDGKPNVIAVRADNTVQPASRWYTGAGIYRHVRLIAVSPVHLERRGVFITTPEVTDGNAVVSVESSVKNQSGKSETVSVQTVITSPSGKTYKTDAAPVTVAAGETATTVQTIEVSDPEIWDIDNPNIYSALTTVSSGKKVIDDQANTFGIRTFSFESETGFRLNGRDLKLLGACIHHDGGPLGSAVPKSAWKRRLEQLKAMGCNAVRGAHAPMNIEIYELCDSMGLLYFDETFDTWTAAKPNGQKAYNLYFKEWFEYDAREAIMRVRNHPCIVLYSLGNEIRDNLNSEQGRYHFNRLKEITNETDPTRPITMALFRPAQSGLYTNGFADMLDVIGQNYNEAGLLGAWKDKAGRKIIGTENTPSRASWLAVKNNPGFSGQFIWAGIDYLGEADWPKISWNEALLDRNAGWKHTSWERQSWWTEEPMVHIVRNEPTDMAKHPVDDWTPADPRDYDTALVTVYSNCDEIELYLNGVSMGKQAKAKDDAPNQWRVKYEEGTIKAIGRRNGRDVAEHQQVTAGKPVKVELAAEQSSIANDWDEVVYVHATVVDENGVRNPNATHKVKFVLDGPGEIVSVDNSDVYGHEMYKADFRSVHKGRAIAIVRAKESQGTITVTAIAPGLESTRVDIEIAPKE